MKSIVKGLGGFALVCSLSPSASAFETQYHLQLCNQTLKALGYGPVSISEIADSDAGVDANTEIAAAHFDSEAFEDGSIRITKEFEQALIHLEHGRAGQARIEIGRALHAVQDFFSHSNFVANRGVADEIDFFSLQNPGRDVVCNPVTQKGELTSGYYPQGARPWPWKCTHQEINKDTSKRPFHDLGMQAAAIHTTAFMKKFESAFLARISDKKSARALLNSFKRL